jgi:hypothetical protein
MVNGETTEISRAIEADLDKMRTASRKAPRQFRRASSRMVGNYVLHKINSGSLQPTFLRGKLPLTFKATFREKF